MATRRQVNIYINGNEVKNNLASIYAEKRKLNRELNQMVRGTEEYENAVRELRKVNNIIDEHRGKIRNVETSWDKLRQAGGRFAGAAAAIFTVDAIVDYGRELFNTATQMEVLEAKARTVFAEALPAVSAAAKENATAMGLTTRQYIDAAAALGDLLIPMGFQRMEAANISTELVDLSGALSEWTGGQIRAEEVSRILGKALLGEREELKQLGIYFSEADVNARLAEKGLAGLTGQLLQQAKATATLELITEKSTDAQAAFLQNSETLVRRQAELRARMEELSERLATLLIPVFERLVSIAESFTSGLEALGNVFGGVEARAREASEAFEIQSDTVNDLERDLTPLIDRYEELRGKSELTKAEQNELETVIAGIAEIVPTAITQFDEYGRAMDVSTTKAKEFIAAQRLILQQRNREAIDENTDALNRYQRELNGIVAALNTTDEDGDPFTRTRTGLRKTAEGFEPVIENVKLTADEIRNLQARADELTSSITTTQNAIRLLSGETVGEQAAQQQEAGPAPATSGSSSRATRETDERIRQLERLRDALEAFREEERQADLTESELKLDRLRQQYDKEIALATELEAQGVEQATQLRLELERMRDQALRDLTIQLISERTKEELAQEQEAFEQRMEQMRELEEQRAEVVRELNEYAREQTLSELELALIQQDEAYQQLRAKAEEFGIDTLDIEIAYQRERAAIRKKFNDQELQEELEKQAAIAKAQEERYDALATIVTSTIDLVGTKTREATALSKFLTIIQVGLDSAKALSASIANAAAAGPFPANLAAIATSIATVLGFFGQVRSILSQTPAVPQRKKGGYFDVMGEDDGRRYRARYIGEPVTGMLPDTPSLVRTSSGQAVLASEVGREYFVSARDLRNPVIFDYVQAIDNISKARQFREGGFTVAPTVAAAGGSGLEQITPMLGQLNALLNQLVNQGVVARIDDDTTIDIRNRLNQLDKAAGR